MDQNNKQPPGYHTSAHAFLNSRAASGAGRPEAGPTGGLLGVLAGVGWALCAAVSSSVKGGGDVTCLSDESTGHARKPSELEEETLGQRATRSLPSAVPCDCICWISLPFALLWPLGDRAGAWLLSPLCGSVTGSQTGRNGLRLFPSGDWELLGASPPAPGRGGRPHRIHGSLC